MRRSHHHLELSKIKNQGFKIILCFFFLGGHLRAEEPTKEVSFSHLKPLNHRHWRKLRRGIVFSNADVNTQEKQQSLDYHVVGLHKKNCQKALRKLFLYESYSSFISFITHSAYDENNNKMFLRFNHALIPIPLSLTMVIEPISKPGLYPFQLPTGMLKGLKGHVQVSEHQQRCLVEMHSTWKGPPSRFNDTIFEVFASTLGKLALFKLFRISKI